MANASTGTPLWPGASTFPGASVFPGQGTQPIWRCYLSTDAMTVAAPHWTDITPDLLEIASDRGGDVNQTGVDTGTCTVRLNNRQRQYDPLVTATIRPFNRVWVFAEFSSFVLDVFTGYVETWNQTWPSGDWSNAEAVAECVDELAVLGLEELPVTSPPAASYADLIQNDRPDGYWGLATPVTEFVPDEQWTPPDTWGTATEANPPVWRRFHRKKRHHHKRHHGG